MAKFVHVVLQSSKPDKMKRFCLLMSLLFSGISMYPQVFHKFLSQSDVSGILYRVTPASDGGYAAVGTLTEQPSFNDQFLVTRFNNSGVAEWSKMMGSDDSDEFTDIVETPDGGLVAVGTSYNNDNFFINGFVEKFNADGSRAWSKKIMNGSNSCMARKIQGDASGNLYIAGTLNIDESNVDYFILKMDANGAIVRQSVFGGFDSEFLLAFLRKSNGDLFISGWINTGTGENIHLVKLNPDLAVTWNSQFTGDDMYFGYDLKEKPNGNVLLAGRFDGVNLFYDVLLAEIDQATGNPVWAKHYTSVNPAYIHAYGLAVQPDNRIALTGIVEGLNAMNLYLETDATGNIVRSKSLSNANETSSTGYGICASPDGGFTVCGSRYSSDSSSVFLLKTDADGETACFSTNYPLTAGSLTLDPEILTMHTGIQTLTTVDASYTETLLNSFVDACDPVSVDEPVQEEEFSIFPNPTDGKFTINVPPAWPEATLVLIDMNGTVVYRVEHPHSTVLVPGLHLSPGVYFAGLVSKESRQFRKILIR